MKKYFFLSYLFFIQIFLSAQQLYNVKFIVLSYNLPDSVKIYIAGNQKNLGSWDPGRIELNKINDSTWCKTLSFPFNSKIEFKFTKGTWGKEALNDDKTIPPNKSLTVIKDTVVLTEVKYWEDQSERKFTGKITGTVEYIRKLKGEGLKPRDIIIWLPPGYSLDTIKHYPVLYMQDGQNIIDPRTSATGIDWGIDETADSLIKSGAIHKIIIVGIYNTVDRSSEYSKKNTGELYMRFIIKKLKPLIDRKYRTLPDAYNTAVGGSSLGGLISFMLAWEYPEIFSKAICCSPAFDIDNFNFITPVKEYNGQKKTIKIFIDIGTIGLEDSLMKGVNEMLLQLKEKGYREGKDLMFYKDENAMHSEAYWSKQVWRFLEFMFGKK